MTNLVLRSNRTAETAFSAVAARKELESVRDYATAAHRLPGMILQNGLAHATGYLLIRGGSSDFALLEDLARVMACNQVTAQLKRTDEKAVHDAAVQVKGSTHAMQLTRNALECSALIKRYVQAELRMNASGTDLDDGENNP